MNSNLVFILLLLFAAALIVFAVLPPLRRWQRDREWEEFGTDLDIGGAIAGRIDGAASSAVVPQERVQERLEARADPTGGQDGERTQTDIALEELKRLERLNLSLDDEFDAFEEYLSGRRQDRARHSGPGQSLRGLEGRGQGPRRDLAGRDLPGSDPRRDTGEQNRPAEVERPADLAQAAQLEQAPDGQRVEIEAETANSHYPAVANGLTAAGHLGDMAGISPGDTAEDLVRAAGGPAPVTDLPGDDDQGQEAQRRPSDGAFGPQRGPSGENGRETYDWKAAAQYERARAARAGGPGRAYPPETDAARPSDAVPADAAPSTPPFGLDTNGRIIDRRDLAGRMQGPERRPSDAGNPAPHGPPTAEQPAARHGWPPAQEQAARQPGAPALPRVHVVEPPAQDAELPTVHVVEPQRHSREQPRVRVAEPASVHAQPVAASGHQARGAEPFPVQVVEPHPRLDEPPAVYAVGPSQQPEAHGGGYAATPPGGAQAPGAAGMDPGMDQAPRGAAVGYPRPDDGQFPVPDPPFMEPQSAAEGSTALQMAELPHPELPPVLSEDEINDLRSRWLEIKASFPDDPITAVREAKQLVNECTDLLAERLEVRRDQGEVSTEDLRLALRRYVAFYERLLWA